MRLVPINAEVSDFADTAAIIGQLDLVITVDTSVAHIAGALGRPAWVLIANRPDWRWQLAGGVSPWYPTLRLFRQGDDGGWPPVVEAIRAALRELVVASRSMHGHVQVRAETPHLPAQPEQQSAQANARV